MIDNNTIDNIGATWDHTVDNTKTKSSTYSIFIEKPSIIVFSSFFAKNETKKNINKAINNALIRSEVCKNTYKDNNSIEDVCSKFESDICNTSVLNIQNNDRELIYDQIRNDETQIYKQIMYLKSNPGRTFEITIMPKMYSMLFLMYSDKKHVYTSKLMELERQVYKLTINIKPDYIKSSCIVNTPFVVKSYNISKSYNVGQQHLLFAQDKSIAGCIKNSHGAVTSVTKKHICFEIYTGESNTMQYKSRVIKRTKEMMVNSAINITSKQTDNHQNLFTHMYRYSQNNNFICKKNYYYKQSMNYNPQIPKYILCAIEEGVNKISPETSITLRINNNQDDSRFDVSEIIGMCKDSESVYVLSSIYIGNPVQTIIIDNINAIARLHLKIELYNQEKYIYEIIEERIKIMVQETYIVIVGKYAVYGAKRQYVYLHAMPKNKIDINKCIKNIENKLKTVKKVTMNNSGQEKIPSEQIDKMRFSDEKFLTTDNKIHINTFSDTCIDTMINT